MSTRATFEVKTVLTNPDATKHVRLLPVADDPENAMFFGAGGAASIYFSNVSEAASAAFVEGAQLHVDFTPKP